MFLTFKKTAKVSLSSLVFPGLCLLLEVLKFRNKVSMNGTIKINMDYEIHFYCTFLSHKILTNDILKANMEFVHESVSHDFKQFN